MPLQSQFFNLQGVDQNKKYYRIIINDSIIKQDLNKNTDSKQ